MTLGEKIGRWTIIELTSSAIRFRCRCTCGAERVLYEREIERSAERPCKCHLAEVRRAAKTTHGEAVRDRVTPEYRIWRNMRDRCLRPSNHAYADYGGRGITICDRWSSFEAFLEDMGRRPSPRHTIDRKDNDGPYSPDNCRWATKAEQANNRRSARLLTINGETRSLTDWARSVGMQPRALWSRLLRGWTPERAISTPINI